MYLPSHHLLPSGPATASSSDPTLTATITTPVIQIVAAGQTVEMLCLARSQGPQVRQGRRPNDNHIFTRGLLDNYNYFPQIFLNLLFTASCVPPQNRVSVSWSKAGSELPYGRAADNRQGRLIISQV